MTVAAAGRPRRPLPVRPDALTDTEQLVAAVWREVLGRDRVGVDRQLLRRRRPLAGPGRRAGPADRRDRAGRCRWSTCSATPRIRALAAHLDRRRRPPGAGPGRARARRATRRNRRGPPDGRPRQRDADRRATMTAAPRPTTASNRSRSSGWPPGCPAPRDIESSGATWSTASSRSTRLTREEHAGPGRQRGGGRRPGLGAGGRIVEDFDALRRRACSA